MFFLIVFPAKAGISAFFLIKLNIFLVPTAYYGLKHYLFLFVYYEIPACTSTSHFDKLSMTLSDHAGIFILILPLDLTNRRLYLQKY